MILRQNVEKQLAKLLHNLTKSEVQLVSDRSLDSWQVKKPSQSNSYAVVRAV